MTNKHEIRVELDDRSYTIHVGVGLISAAGKLIAPILRRPQTVIVTDEHVAALHLSDVQASLAEAGIKHETVTLPAGEATKNFEELDRLCCALLENGVERGDTVIALGGGVIGDITGFAAAILRRGVEFIQVPTSLLAQVDSSVGGKTAINVKQGKNLIGAFHQPRLVIADMDVLDTLPRRELLAGYAEIVKYAVIDQPDFMDWLERNGNRLLDGDSAARAYAVALCCAAKARIVGEDEREAGNRALLNLGHTFAHALEAECGYDGRLLHGEAVAIGLVMAASLSEQLGLSTVENTTRLRTHLASVGLPTLPSDVEADWSAERLIAHMAQDKKVVDGRATFVLLKGIGNAFLSRDVERTDLMQLLEEMLG